MGLLIQRLQAESPRLEALQILVVDNGSQDFSAQVAEKAGAEVISCRERGYGAALRYGILRAHYDHIAVLDADLTYLPTDLIRLLTAFNNEGADLLLGDRLRGRIETSAMPGLHRHFGTPFLSFVLRSLFRGLGDLRDCNSGYRIFRKSDFIAWGLQSSGMEIASEMIAKAALQRARVVSVPIDFRCSPVFRQPHLRPWRDGLRHLKTILDIRFSSLMTNSEAYQK